MASAARDALGTMDRDVVADGVLHVHTPLLFSRPMSDLLGRDVYIKLDAFQPSGSFKLRGIGYTCQKALKHGARSFTSSSGGNAGLATAYAGAALGVPTTVVVPSTTPEFIRDRLAALGACVVVHGAQWSEANEEAVRRNEKDGGKLVHPFDDPDTWTGHATLVHETVADLAKATRMTTKDAISRRGASSSSDERNTTIAAFVTCVGGGGLLAGILQGLRETGFAERTRVIAAETLGADSMTTSLECGKVTTLPGITSVAKSLGAAAPSSDVFKMAYELYDRDVESRLVMPLRVTDEDAIRACLRFADDHRVLVEPACGAALAAVYGGQSETKTWLKSLADGPIVVEVCGGAIVDRGVLEAYAKQFGIEE